jgi:hypothetical protein
MIKHSILAGVLLVLMPLSVAAQTAEQTEPAAMEAIEAEFDTSYRPSPSVSARLQREFLDRVRWSAGAAARDSLVEAFAERSPTEIWQELVASDGLKTNNVTDALTSYWVLNWVAANGAYAVKVDSAPVRRQLQIAFANDPNFLKMGDQQRQELAEGYILNFLVEHAALNTAVEKRDLETLNRLAAAAVARFRQDMKVNLLGLVPGPDGFAPRPAVAE